MKKKLWIALSVVGILSSGGSQAARLSLVGAVNQADLNYESVVPIATTPKLGYGGGALVEFPLSKVVGFELGGLYVQRVMESLLVKTTITWVEVPVTLRWWVSPMVSLVVGGYAAFGMGDIKQELGGLSTTSTFAEMGMKKMDYGAVGGLGFNFPLGKSVGLLIEGRYLYGIADLNEFPAISGITKQTYQTIQGLVGLRFGGHKGR